MRCRIPALAAPALACLLASTAAGAHSASDAYLNLTVAAAGNGGRSVIQGQWDIALKDLDFLLTLDDDGDGQVTWGELKHHQAEIEHYAYAHLAFAGGPGDRCAIKPTRQMVDGHADGTYAALFFDVVCARIPKTLTLDYSLFFAIDPSHRGIFVMRSGAKVSTAVLAPENARIDVGL